MRYLDNIDAVLLDIEGTTTSISFVYDELFPYARAKVSTFIPAHWGTAELSTALDELRAQAVSDVEAGVEGAFNIPEEGASLDEIQQAFVKNVLWQMDSDVKTTGLKMLQGMIWVDGYKSGQLKGHLYSDVLPAMERLLSLGKTLNIYSSGSVAAQKLLFGHSVEGDLTPKIRGYFDTTTGPKKEAASYKAIASSLGLEPQRILFLTDNIDEGYAARDAGVSVVMSVRPGNKALPETDFPCITSFSQLFVD